MTFRRPLVLLVLLASFVLIGLGYSAVKVEADQVAGAGYSGVTADFGRITFDVSANGALINSVIVTYPAASVRAGCPTNAVLSNIAISAAHSAAVTGVAANSGQTVAFTAVFAPDGNVTGTVRADPATGSGCTSRGDVAFAAAPISRPAYSPQAGATYTGTSSLGGTLTFTVASDRKSISSGGMVLRIGNCDYSGPLENPINKVVQNGAFDVAVSSTFQTVGTFGSTQVQGAFVVATGPGSSCANLVATFSLAGPAASPLAAFTPAGPYVVGANPVQWNGGDVAALKAAATAAGVTSATYFASGQPIVLVPGAPDFVNQAFSAAFPGGIVPAGTILILTK
jgi:hypothetical protein